MFDIALLLVTYEVKILLGIAALIGYTSDQQAADFCRPGHKHSQKPLRKNTLAEAVEILTATELEDCFAALAMRLVFNGAVKRLVERSLFAHNQGMFALEPVSLRSVGGPILEKAGRNSSCTSALSLMAQFQVDLLNL